MYTISYRPLSTMEKCPTSQVDNAWVISYLYARKFVSPPMTFPNIIPTSGTRTTSLNCIRWINQTKIQVPRIAAVKAKNALPHNVELGRNTRASKIPNCAEEIVAPVDGDTN